MNVKEEFHKYYPLTVLEAMHTICIAVHGWKPLIKDIPCPTVKRSKSFLVFAGANDNAVRTAFSRERKKDNLKFFSDKEGTKRFDLNELGQGLIRFYHNESCDSSGMTMAVFQFETNQNKARYKLKEILASFGFAMFARNTYISRKIDHSELEAAVDAQGLKNNLYLFDTELPQGTALEKIKKLYRTDQLEKDLLLFQKRLLSYYRDSGDEEDCYNRALYSGAAVHIHARMMLPPLPEKLFPGLKTFNELYGEVNDYFEQNFERHLAFYLKQHGGE